MGARRARDARGGDLRPDGRPPLRILLLLYEYDARVRGGMGGFRHAVELGEHWTRLGHDVTILRPRLPARTEPVTVRVVESPFTTVAPLRAASAYAGLLFTGLTLAYRARPDVVYAREMAGPVPLALARTFGAALVLEVNGDSYRHREVRLREAPWRLAALRGLQRLSVTRADAIVTVTAGLRAMLVERFGVSPARIAVVENGTNLDRLVPADPLASRRALGLSGPGRWIGFVGTFFPYQGVATLIDAAPRVLAAHGGVRFLIVGDGPERAEWQEQARRLGVGAAFHFPGQVPHAEIGAWINAMDVCVAPFTADRGESSPLKLFDYFACARPVVVSDIPAVGHLIEVSGGCVAVPPDDAAALAAALSRLLSDPAQRARLGAAGRAWVARGHGWDAVAGRVLEVCAAAQAARQSARR